MKKVLNKKKPKLKTYTIILKDKKGFTKTIKMDWKKPTLYIKYPYSWQGVDTFEFNSIKGNKCIYKEI